MSITSLFKNNQKWAETQIQKDSFYFSSRAKEQKPEYLWIGCSDSRIPVNQILGLSPGEIFVHRNIANIAVSDWSGLSVLQFAVEVLQVKHIIVGGHYNCGGIKAALKDKNQTIEYEFIHHWIGHIRQTLNLYAKELEEMPIAHKSNRLAELHTIEQVQSIRNSSIVQKAWRRGQELSLHGWIYTLETGLLKDLNVSVNN